MAGKVFSAQIADWVRKIDGLQDAVVKDATQRMIFRASRTVSGVTRGNAFVRGKVPVDTGRLAASLQSTLNGATLGTGEESYTAVIAGMEAGDTAQFGWGGPAADYVLPVHYGTKDMPGRHWVTDAIVGWQGDVDAAVAEAKAAIG